MAYFTSLLPLILFVLCSAALLFATASNRRGQWLWVQTKAGKIAALPSTWRLVVKAFFTLKRVVVIAALLFLGSYLLVYHQVQDEVEALLAAEKKLSSVAVGSLVMPYTAFFQSEFIANTGFSDKKRRARAEVSVSGYWWSGLRVHIPKIEMAKVDKVVGKKFVFSYLTGTKKLKPEINRHLGKLRRAKQIDKFKIETFDNRGPYILVVLGEKNRAGDINKIATGIAKSLHTYLTKTKKLKVNQVVIKVLAPEPYLKNKTVKVIGRGKAGTY